MLFHHLVKLLHCDSLLDLLLLLRLLNDLHCAQRRCQLFRGDLLHWTKGCKQVQNRIEVDGRCNSGMFQFQFIFHYLESNALDLGEISMHSSETLTGNLLLGCELLRSCRLSVHLLLDLQSLEVPLRQLLARHGAYFLLTRHADLDVDVLQTDGKSHARQVCTALCGGHSFDQSGHLLASS